MQGVVTIGDLFSILGEPRHRITYAIERSGIEPVGRVGITRVWSVDDIPRVREALAKTAANHVAMGRCFARGPIA